MFHFQTIQYIHIFFEHINKRKKVSDNIIFEKFFINLMRF